MAFFRSALIMHLQSASSVADAGADAHAAVADADAHPAIAVVDAVAHLHHPRQPVHSSASAHSCSNGLNVVALRLSETMLIDDCGNCCCRRASSVVLVTTASMTGGAPATGCVVSTWFEPQVASTVVAPRPSPVITS